MADKARYVRVEVDTVFVEKVREDVVDEVVAVCVEVEV